MNPRALFLLPLLALTSPPALPACIQASPPQAGSYPNRPATYTKSSELDFSQAIPGQPDNEDRPIPAAPPTWAMIYFGSNWTSADGVWTGTWRPGSYGGGVIGQGGGHGIGNVFTRVSMPTPRLYMSMRVYFDFDPSQWHPISNKFVNIETDAGGLILVQLMEGGNWRHAEELVNGGSFFVDGGRSAPGENHVPGQVSNIPVPTRKWVQIEVLIDLPNRVFKIWQDGMLTTDARPPFRATLLKTVGWNAFRGGGGETLNAQLGYRYDHFFLAW